MKFGSCYSCIPFSWQMCGIYNQNFVWDLKISWETSSLVPRDSPTLAQPQLVIHCTVLLDTTVLLYTEHEQLCCIQSNIRILETLLAWAVSVPVPLFSPFFSSLSTFLIDLVLGSKIYFAKNLDQTPSKTLLAIFGALVVIFDFAGVAALQAVSKSPRRRTMILNDPKTAKTPKN